jgi:hypothetical protein
MCGYGCGYGTDGGRGLYTKTKDKIARHWVKLDRLKQQLIKNHQWKFVERVDGIMLALEQAIYLYKDGDTYIASSSPRVTVVRKKLRGYKPSGKPFIPGGTWQYLLQLNPYEK